MVSLPLIILGITLYFYLRENLLQKNEEKLRLLVETQRNSLIQIINSEKLEAQLMAQQDSIRKLLSIKAEQKGPAYEDKLYSNSAMNVLKKAISSGRIKTSFIVDRQGKIIASTDSSIIGSSLGSNKNFINAFNRESTVTDVFLPMDNMGNIVAITAPVVDENNEVMGVIGNAIDLRYFKSNVLGVAIGDTGYFYLIDSKGNMISHPDEGKIGQKVENTVIQGVVNDISKYKNQDAIAGRYVYRGTERVTAYEVIPGVNWVIVASQDAAEITRTVVFISEIIAGTTVVLLILSILVSLNFSRLITGPIEKLMRAMKNAADGDLTAKSEIESHDEFGSLSTSFNIMMEKLTLSYEELSALYEELYATEEELRAQYEELQHNEVALRNSKERYKTALENANDAIWEWDISEGKFYASDKWKDIMGIDYKENINLVDIFEEGVYPEDVKKVRQELKKHIRGESILFKAEFRLKNRDKNNDYTWVYAKGKTIKDENGKIAKIAGSISNISERKRAAQKIEHLAYYDQLTGLPNRVFFTSRLEEEMTAAKIKGSTGAVMYIDLDNFKNINDTLGHEYGDMLLKELSERFNKIKSDGDSIYRLGGDEFGILRASAEGHSNIREFAEKILAVFEEVYSLLDKSIHISGSIGVALYPDDGDSSGVILKKADMAMYRAKENGKNRYELFDDSLYNALERKLHIEEVLRNALKEDGFYLLYQPQHDILTRKVVGFEALLRIRQDKYGFISPAEFIPVAEESGLIVQIGEWVLREACRKNRCWKKMGYSYESISVNISSVQIQSQGFLNMVEDALNETGLPAEYLELEITESILMQSMKHSVNILNRLKEMGIRLSLDDFGTGYSSLNYLKIMPINTLKMDKSFIDGICLNKKEETIANAIVDMAHILDIVVIAEGVETEEQLGLLSKHSCDRVQGYLFNKPLSEENAEELLRRTSGGNL